jgi:hypothetical protein
MKDYEQHEATRDENSYREIECGICERPTQHPLPYNGQLICERCLYELVEVQAELARDEERKES